MRGVVDLLHAGGGDVGVYLGGAKVGVTQEFLDAAEVGAVVEEVGGETVAEFVGADFKTDGGVPEVFLEEVIDGAHGEAAAEFAQKEGAFVDAGGLAIVLDRAEGRPADGTEAVFPAFAGYPEGFVKVIDVGDIQFDEFVEAEAGAVEKLQDGGVALRSPGGGALGAIRFEGEGKGKEFVDLAGGQDDGERALGFGELDFEEGIGGETLAAGQVFEERAEGGELDADGGAAEFAFHEKKQPGAEIVRSEVGPGAENREAGAEGAETLRIVFEGEGGGIALDLHELQKLGFQTIGSVQSGRGGDAFHPARLRRFPGFPGKRGRPWTPVFLAGTAAPGGDRQRIGFCRHMLIIELSVINANESSERGR